MLAVQELQENPELGEFRIHAALKQHGDPHAAVCAPPTPTRWPRPAIALAALSRTGRRESLRAARRVPRDDRGTR
jgi:hypothetical protein